MARVIPVTIHLYQADLLNLEPVRAQINHDFVTNFAEEITEVVGVRIINQAQDAIQRGYPLAISTLIRRPYVNINNINEIQTIASLHLSILLPKIQPDRLYYAIALKPSSMNLMYRQLKRSRYGQITHSVNWKGCKDFSQTLQHLGIEDPVAAELSNRLMQNFKMKR